MNSLRENLAHPFDAFLWIWIPYGKMGLTGLYVLLITSTRDGKTWLIPSMLFMDMNSLRENVAHPFDAFYGYEFPTGKRGSYLRCFLWMWIPYGKRGLTGLYVLLITSTRDGKTWLTPSMLFMDVDSLRENQTLFPVGNPYP